jgi:hypothetical protein
LLIFCSAFVVMTVVVDVATMPDHGGGNTGDAIGGASEAMTFFFFF